MTHLRPKTCILARPSLLPKEEFKAMQQFFDVYTLRSAVPANSQVIGRMSVLPYYKEVYDDLKHNNATLVNDPYEHEVITTMDWINVVGELTFPTWWHAQDIPQSERDTPFVVKGEVNSKKFQWNSSMYAANFREAVLVAANLRNDAFIGMQPIVFRKYVPLHTYAVDEHSGLPYVNEWRVFAFKGHIVFEQFYWETLLEDNPDAIDHANKQFAQSGRQFAEFMLNHCYTQDETVFPSFIAMDIAQTQDGSWRVVEINDGQMSGLNGANPMAFYEALAHVVAQTEVAAAKAD